MPSIYELDVPVLDHEDPTLVGDRLHEVLGGLASQSWLARTNIGFVVLDRQAVVEVLRDRRLAFPALPILGLQGIVDGPAFDRTAKGLMVRSGEPHLRLRRLVAPAFAPSSVGRLRSSLRGYLDERWRVLGPGGRMEFVSALAQPLPAFVLADLLGVPEETERLTRWSILLQAVFKMHMAEAREEVERAYDEVGAWTLEMLAERRGLPGDDLISTFGRIEVDGDRLTDDEVITLVIAVISGGVDTTQAQLSHGMRLFARHPDQWDLLAERPELASQAAGEVLRYEPITPFTARIALENVEYRGVEVPAGTLLFACTATANRDGSAFERPNEFDISVDRGIHAPILTFGFGDHFCLGAQLARMELAEAFGYLAPRMGELQLDGEPEFGSILGIYAMESLPIRFQPGDG
jgi:cytochrome P450